MAHAPEPHPDTVYRVVPDAPTGVGVLVLRGSSGAIDRPRVELLAGHGALAEGYRWFGGPGQQPGPYEVPLESIAARVAALRADCDRVVVIGASFGAEGALAAAAALPGIDAVVAFAPSDVVWAGVTPEGRQTSHWTLGGEPVPYVDLLADWESDTDPPAYRGLYLASRAAAPDRAVAASIAVERIARVVLVSGGDDQVWLSTDHADRIAARRRAHGLDTTVVSLAAAGHYCTLPGEPPTAPGAPLARGGSPAAAADWAGWPGRTLPRCCGPDPVATRRARCHETRLSPRKAPVAARRARCREKRRCRGVVRDNGRLSCAVVAGIFALDAYVARV